MKGGGFEKCGTTAGQSRRKSIDTGKAVFPKWSEAERCSGTFNVALRCTGTGEFVTASCSGADDFDECLRLVWKLSGRKEKVYPSVEISSMSSVSCGCDRWFAV